MTKRDMENAETVTSWIRDQLVAFGRRNIRNIKIDTDDQNGRDSAIKFGPREESEYIQITSYDGGKHFLLSWAISGFTKARPLLALCKTIEFDYDAFTGTGKAPPSFQIADGEYHYKATVAIAERYLLRPSLLKAPQPSISRYPLGAFKNQHRKERVTSPA